MFGISNKILPNYWLWEINTMKPILLRRECEFILVVENNVYKIPKCFSSTTWARGIFSLSIGAPKHSSIFKSISCPKELKIFSHSSIHQYDSTLPVNASSNALWRFKQGRWPTFFSAFFSIAILRGACKPWVLISILTSISCCLAVCYNVKPVLFCMNMIVYT